MYDPQRPWQVAVYVEGTRVPVRVFDRFLTEADATQHAEVIHEQIKRNGSTHVVRVEQTGTTSPRATLYTKAQTLRLLHVWGYSEGTLPQRHRPESFAHIPPECRTGSNTRARVTWAGTNGAGQRLYGVEFVP